ncbi:insulinase family protein [Candidatus Sumerlaeota bacterium]|nr:insulinase family protein [Candidatus Sumerlaeota bacterium]
MRRIAALISIALALIALAPAQSLEGRVEELVLDNGMTFLLMNRGDAPVFSGVIRWNVGSSDEPVGQTGIAHMFEHMAFKGTSTIGTSDWEAERPVLEALNEAGTALARERLRGEDADPERLAALEEAYEAAVEAHRQFVVKDELDMIYSAAGAVGLNAWTSRDFTNYHVSLPANALELWCLCESARIRDGVLREFYSERDVVYEERRMRTDTDPTGALIEDFLAMAFLAHPYGDPTIGWPSDIENLTTADAEAFYAQHYVPANAVAAIVGNFDMEEARRLIHEYFDPIPAAEPPPGVTTVEPPQRGERRVEIEWDAEPIVVIGYHKPNPPDHTDAVFDVIHSILSRGRTSRLYTRMIKEEQIAVEADAFSFPGDRFPNLSAFFLVPRAPHTPEDLEAALFEELERLATEPVSERELQRVINQLDADFLRGLRSNLGMANQLAYWQLIGDDWRWTERWVEEIRSVTAEQIMAVAAEYYTEQNRTVGILRTRVEDELPPAEETESAVEVGA